MGIGLAGVTKRFAGQPAVDGITAEIAPGELFAIVGASGCGKSTLLRLIAGLEMQDAGEIRLMGARVAGPGTFVPPEAREIGFVFQSYALWPHMSVLGNVAFPAEARGRARAEAEAEARRHLETVALGAYAARRPEALSGGQRQRVALARCLAGGARIVLMDEPLANLDPHLRATMERELLDFHRASGTTTVYITHDQREAMALADRLAVMEAGRFLQVGPPETVHDRPASAAVARFIGRGALQPVLWRDGRAELAGRAVPAAGAPGGDGRATALFRPGDLALAGAGDGALPGRVADATYRGGAWEARVAVEGLPEPFEVTAPRRLSPGETVHLRVTGGWVLPA